MAAIIGGQWVHESPTLAPLFTFDGKTLTWMLIVYGFVAASIPVWLLLAPRDYLSTWGFVITPDVLAQTAKDAAGHRGAVQDEEGPLCLGDHRAGRVAAGLHADGGLA